MIRIPQICPALSFFFLSVLGALAADSAAILDKAAALEQLEKMNVEWSELGESSRDSMPLGNGDLAANIRVEENGDVCLYLAKSDSWSEMIARSEGLLKLGRIRLSFSPNSFKPWTFRQVLCLREGAVELMGGGPGKELRVKLWVDAHANVLRIEAESGQPVACRVQLEPLRIPEQQALKDETLRSALHSDDIVAGRSDSIVWYYHNTREVAERLKEERANFNTESLDKLTSGGKIQGAGFCNEGDLVLKSDARVRHDLQITTLVRQTETPEAWITELDGLTKTFAKSDIAEAWKKHRTLESTLQSMLLQADGKRLLLFPAWPEEWNVQFRLHAPGRTIVMAAAEHGKVKASEVSPSARTSDLQFSSSQ